MDRQNGLYRSRQWLWNQRSDQQMVGLFLVFNAENEQELYRFNTGGPISGGVITYERDGKQYVAVAAGNSGGSIPLVGQPTVVVFGE